MVLFYQAYPGYGYVDDGTRILISVFLLKLSEQKWMVLYDDKCIIWGVDLFLIYDILRLYCFFEIG